MNPAFGLQKSSDIPAISHHLIGVRKMSIFGNNVLFRSSLQRNKPLFATDPFEAGNFAFGNKKTQSSRYSRAKEWKSHMNAYV